MCYGIASSMTVQTFRYKALGLYKTNRQTNVSTAFTARYAYALHIMRLAAKAVGQT